MQASDIQGWCDFEDIYGDAIARAQDGARFVEVGAWLGRSTAYMGQRIIASGKRITFDTVDTWDGGTDSPANLLLRKELVKQKEPLFDQFIRNMKECGVAEHVRPVRADSAKAAVLYSDLSLDFVFIDGDHSAPCVQRDLEAYWPKVKYGGILAGHDIREGDVAHSLQDFCQRFGVSYYRQGSSWIIEKVHVQPARVLLGIPHSGKLFADAAMAAMMHPSGTPGVVVEVTTHQTSLLAAGFNFLWSKALAGNYTHFAMLHADIKPDWNWLDIMLAELQRTGANLISAVSPIKDERGLTSTAIGHPDIWWSPKRRLTMREVVKLPPTFTAEDAGYPGHALLINTGCWLADVRDPRWRDNDADGMLNIYFNIRDRITKTGDQYIGYTQSEDWFFSMKMFEHGLKAVATRKVQLGHYSDFPWPNYCGFGRWEHDNDTRPHWEGNGHSKA